MEVPFLDAAQGCEKVISLRLKQAGEKGQYNELQDETINMGHCSGQIEAHLKIIISMRKE